LSERNAGEVFARFVIHHLEIDAGLRQLAYVREGNVRVVAVS
jgi:hypothetical protein